MTFDLLTARCCCCTEAARLLPRADLAPDLSVCPRSGRLHRVEGEGFILVEDGPPLARRPAEVARPPVVLIDLSKEGYA